MVFHGQRQRAGEQQEPLEPEDQPRHGEGR